MARHKQSAVRRKASKRTRQAKPGKASFRRFLTAFCTAAALSFGVSSAWLNPQWEIAQRLDDALVRLGWQHEPFPPLLSSGAPLAQTSFAACRDLFPAGAAPLVPSGPALRELCFDAFAVLHSGQTRTPVFVAQRLNRQMLVDARQIQRTDRFYAEGRLPQSERAMLDDYRGSGYSRGHMAPAGDMHTSEAMAQSFSLANMAPQDQAHNAGAWNKIEQDTRNYIMRAAGDVHVFTGPVYVAQQRRIGSGVAVPDYFYKLVYDARSGRSWVHWQANRADARAGRPIDYEEFVRRTGLHLLPEARLGYP